MTASNDIEVFNVGVPFAALIGILLFFGVLMLVGMGCRKWFDKEDVE